MHEAPILIIAFNQPIRLARLLDSLRANPPTSVRICIDGPRVLDDEAGTVRCRQLAEQIDWIEDLEVWARKSNLGISRGIPEAVSRALREFGRIFVVEDDVTLGPQAHEFMTRALSVFEDHSEIFSISAYNSVPEESISSPDDPVRLSRVMSSYAWGTWEDRWYRFDPETKWFRNQKTKDLAALLGSRKAALRWKQHIRFVQKNLVQCAAYRWNASTWKFDGCSVVPNRNLIEYHGATGGTHTRRKRPWTELPVGELDLDRVTEGLSHLSIDWRAEDFLQRTTQRVSYPNIAFGPFEEIALRLQRRGWI